MGWVEKCVLMLSLLPLRKLNMKQLLSLVILPRT
jgi:hypothetical protein